MKHALMALLLLAAAAGSAAAQSWDNSGNNQLNGAYYFRHVLYFWNGDAYGDLGEAIAVYGNITFDGAGNYTLSQSCEVADSSVGYLMSCAAWLQYVYGTSATTSGTYSISASGYGVLSNPLFPADPTHNVYGLVSPQGILVGSSTESSTTESGLNDFFVAAKVSAATNATFQGSYSIAALDLSNCIAPYQNYVVTGNALGYMFQVNPDGAGNLGSGSATGYVGRSGSQAITQTISSIRYTLSSGAFVLPFPISSANLVSGTKYLYISPDGNFVFGGSPTAWDFFVGVRTGTGTPNFGGLGVPYYQAGIDETVTSNSVGALDTYYGSINASGGSLVEHQRLASVLNATTSNGSLIEYPIDYTYGDAYPANASTYSATAMRYVVGKGAMRYAVGAGGAVRIGSGIGPNLGLNVALAAPTLSGPGVYLNPLGIVNAASWAPFTAAIVPGEFLTLFGTGLAPSGFSATATVPYHNILGGVQVMFNNIPAPLYFVTPGEISAIVPYGINEASGSVVTIQVINNNVASNTVTMYAGLTAPGVFTLPENGLGYGAVLHNADYSVVTASHPAQPGETVLVYVSGLGAVSPTVADGTAAPGSPSYSLDTNTITVYIGGQSVTPAYSGLAPGFAGLYQLNVQVPTGLTAGDNPLEIVGPDSDTVEALIPVGTGSAAASVATPGPEIPPLARPAALCGSGPTSCAAQPRSSRNTR